jgi:hypothetical protein
VTASPAAAVGGCPSATLCLAEDKNYVDTDVTTKTTAKNCIPLGHFGETGFYNGIGSYVNNLPVSVDVYYDNGRGYTYESTIRPGGFSSDTSAVYKFGYRGAVCTAGANPNTLLT